MPDINPEQIQGKEEISREAPSKKIVEKSEMAPTKVVSAEQYEDAAPERKQQEEKETQALMEEFLEKYRQGIIETVMSHENIESSKVRGICVEAIFGLAPGHSREKEEFVYLAPEEDGEALAQNEQGQENVIKIFDRIGDREITVRVFLQKTQ